MRHHYQTNAAGEVKSFEVTDNGTITAGYYPAGTLYKNGLEDENRNTTYTYTDLQGRVVLKRAPNTGKGTHDTYYLYDAYGNLRYVLPKAQGKTDATTLAQLCFQYHYDHRNRIIHKQLPGKGVEWMVYDRLDRLVLHQDAAMRTAGKALKTVYDAHNRITQTGWISAATTYTLLAEQTEASITQVLQRNSYDDYRGLTALSAPPQGATHGLPTWSQTRVLGTSDWVTTATGYDSLGRMNYTATHNEATGITEVQSHPVGLCGTDHPNHHHPYPRRKNHLLGGRFYL